MGAGLRLRARRKDGSEFPCEIGLTAIDGAAGPIAVAAVRDITDRLAIEAALRESEDRRRDTLEKMLRLQDEERSKLAADLHDDTIQAMTAALLTLGVVERRVRDLGDPRSEAALAEALRSLSHAIERTRRMTFDLRPQLLEADGLGAAVRAPAADIAAQAGLTGTVDTDVGRDSDTLESLAYRTIQESLANVRKHAKASRVTVALHEAGGALVGTVTDDGIGFDSGTELERARRTFHVGLDIVSERVRLAGGSLEVASSPGVGHRASLHDPDPAGAARAT